jgi:hypothetical protein
VELESLDLQLHGLSFDRPPPADSLEVVQGGDKPITKSNSETKPGIASAHRLLSIG